MPDTTSDPGEELPRKAESSLPRYAEPPLRERTHRHLGREEVAERDLKGTVFRPGAMGLLIAVFLVTITVPAILQFSAEVYAGRGLPSFDVIRTLPKWEKIRAARHPADFWNLTPQADDIKDFEKGMEKGSIISRWLLPHVQNTLTHLGAGNEQAYPGRPAGCSTDRTWNTPSARRFSIPCKSTNAAARAHVRADPIPAILLFRDQLKERGIELVVFPVPVKPVIEGDMLSATAATMEALQNPSFAEFKRRLEKEGVRVSIPPNY